MVTTPSEQFAPDSRLHYAGLAERYDTLWEHTSGFQHWMCSKILHEASPPDDAVIADIGGGTGIYARGVAARLPRAVIHVVDPSTEMLSSIDSSPQIRSLVASASEATRALRDSGVVAVDLVLIKEAVHHFASPREDLQSLVKLLEPGGAMLVVMLPTKIGYPLFPDALRRFEQWQPDPARIELWLKEMGLVTRRRSHSYPLALTRDHWVEMVEGRFMSLLSSFGDSELAQGVEEIKAQIGDAEAVEFEDRFEFVLGRTPSLQATTATPDG